MLVNNSLENDCEMLNKNCYENIITTLGAFKIPIIKNMTIERFCKIHDSGTFIVRTNGHLTCIQNGICLDTFDCTQDIVLNAWYVKSNDE